MKLTTIFTGHTLDLRDIVAIGPPICLKKDGVVSLFVDLHLKGSEKIRHITYHIEHYNFNEEKYDACVDKLTEQRAELVQQWEASQAQAATYTEDPKVEYQTNADNSRSIIQFEHE